MKIRLQKVLSIILILAIVGAIGTLGYVIAAPKNGENITDFYILGLGGKAENYPKEVVKGQEVGVIAGIVNHTNQVVSYRLEVTVDGVVSNTAGPLVLGHDEEWEGVVSFIPQIVGNNQKMEFLLYKNEESEPCLKPLLLWVDVKER